MLKRLQNRLRIFLIVVFMAIVTLILCFSFHSIRQAQQTADITYIQRIASLIIYQLEADSSEPETLLADYESEMHVYSLLTDEDGSVLFRSAPVTRTGPDTLWKTAEKSMSARTTDGILGSPAVTEQSGYMEISGDNGDHYLAICASILTKSQKLLSLILFYEEPSAGSLLAEQAPAYCAIWLLAFAGILIVSRFLLRRAFAPTEQVLEGQKDFIAAASHELKSPLAVIMANAEAIQDAGETSPQVRESLGIIDAECTRMSGLIRDMLLLAASDADQWTLQKTLTDVDTLLITLYEAYEPVCLKKNIRLKLELDEKSYPPLFTDQERVFQILSIFLDNAVYYSPENSSIEIKTRQTARELIFLVADHGSGIAEEDKPFIFDRFYCADKSRTDKSHFGLGLSIAKELSGILSGKVWFEDTPGGGATFFLSLPLGQPPA